MDAIKVTYIESALPDGPVVAYAEWTRQAQPGAPKEEQWAWADVGKFNPKGYSVDEDGVTREGEVRGIPQDVRDTIAKRVTKGA